VSTHLYAATDSPQGPWGPSDILFLVLAAAALLTACFILGGLASHPFAP